MSDETLPDEPEPSAPPRGSVLDVLRTLLGDHEGRDVVPTSSASGHAHHRSREAARSHRGAVQGQRRVGGTPTPDVIEVEPIKIDQPRHTVTVSGDEVHLIPIEFRLLETGPPPGRVLTHHQLLREPA